MSSNKFEETRGIRAIMIIEVIGKPPEHLVETLNNLIKQIDEEKSVRVNEKKVNEPILMKEQKDFYTSFAEIEVEVEDIMYLASLMFKYMPAHIEIISPEFIALSNNGWSEILSEIIRRLHGYDEVARIIQIEKAVLEKKLMELMPQEGTRTSNEVSKEKVEEEKKEGEKPKKKRKEKKME